MYGTHVNTLNVYLKSGSSLGTPVWTHTGTLSNKWYNANVNIKVYIAASNLTSLLNVK